MDAQMGSNMTAAGNQTTLDFIWSYFKMNGGYSAFLYLHVFLMVFTFAVLIPFGMVLAWRKSKMHMFVQFLALLAASGGVATIIYDSYRYGDLPGHTFHGKVGLGTMAVFIIQALLGCFRKCCKRGPRTLHRWFAWLLVGVLGPFQLISGANHLTGMCSAAHGGTGLCLEYGLEAYAMWLLAMALYIAQPYGIDTDEATVTCGLICCCFKKYSLAVVEAWVFMLVGLVGVPYSFFTSRHTLSMPEKWITASSSIMMFGLGALSLALCRADVRVALNGLVTSFIFVLLAASFAVIAVDAWIVPPLVPRKIMPVFQISEGGSIFMEDPADADSLHSVVDDATMLAGPGFQFFIFLSHCGVACCMALASGFRVAGWFNGVAAMMFMGGCYLFFPSPGLLTFFHPDSQATAGLYIGLLTAAMLCMWFVLSCATCCAPNPHAYNPLNDEDKLSMAALDKHGDDDFDGSEETLHEL